MPIIDIEVIGGAVAAPGLCDEIAQAIGAALGAPEGSVWLTLTRRPAVDYAENGPPPVPPPVLVRVLAKSEHAPDRAKRAHAIASAVAGALARPLEGVHVIFEPDASGRVFFGGRPDPA